MIGAGLFKSTGEKLAARLADLEAQVASLTKRAEEGRVAEAEAQDKLVEDLAEGLPVDDWRKKREAAEKRASDSERDLQAARKAASLVRGRLEEVQTAELLESLQKRYAEVQKFGPGVLEEVLSTGRAFSHAIGRLEWLRSEETSVIWQLRQAGDSETQIRGFPLVENLLADELPAMNGGNDGRQTFRTGIPIWPSRHAS